MGKRKRSKQKSYNKILLTAAAIVAVLGVYIWLTYSAQKKEQEARFALYPDFGIELPLGYKIHGIDVSSYQGNIHWPAVAQMEDQDVNIRFAFIKATEGLNFVDKQYKRNWQKAREANITRGAYHFFLATKSGRLQAQNFIKAVKLEPGDLRRVLRAVPLLARLAAWRPLASRVLGRLRSRP